MSKTNVRRNRGLRYDFRVDNYDQIHICVYDLDDQKGYLPQHDGLGGFFHHDVMLAQVNKQNYREALYYVAPRNQHSLHWVHFLVQSHFPGATYYPKDLFPVPAGYNNTGIMKFTDETKRQYVENLEPGYYGEFFNYGTKFVWARFSERDNLLSLSETLSLLTPPDLIPSSYYLDGDKIAFELRNMSQNDFLFLIKTWLFVRHLDDKHKVEDFCYPDAEEDFVHIDPKVIFPDFVYSRASLENLVADVFAHEVVRVFKTDGEEKEK